MLCGCCGLGVSSLFESGGRDTLSVGEDDEVGSEPEVDAGSELLEGEVGRRGGGDKDEGMRGRSDASEDAWRVKGGGWNMAEGGEGGDKLVGGGEDGAKIIDGGGGGDGGEGAERGESSLVEYSRGEMPSSKLSLENERTISKPGGEVAA